MALDLRLMRYAVAVAEEGSFRDAADSLHVAQPALSRGVAQLERELGLELFQRRPTRLTASGQAFVERARQILADVDDAVATAHQADRGELGVVQLGYALSAGLDLIPALSLALHRHHPGLRVQATEQVDVELVAALEAGDMDVVVGHDLPSGSGIARWMLRRDPIAAVLRDGHPLTRRRRVHLRELRGEVYRTLPRAAGPRRYDKLVSALRSAGHTSEIWHVPHPGLRAFAVGQVGGFTLLPAPAGRRLPRGVIAVPVADQTPHMDLEVLWRRRGGAPASKLVVALARRLAQSDEGERNLRPVATDARTPTDVA